MSGTTPQTANGGLDPELERALAYVKRPRARPEFEAELREGFLAAKPRAANVPLEDTLEPPPSPRAWAHARRANRYMWAGLAAAILIAFVLVYWKPTDDRWHVLEGTAPGMVNGVVQINFQAPAAGSFFYLDVNGKTSDTFSIAVSN